MAGITLRGEAIALMALSAGGMQVLHARQAGMTSIAVFLALRIVVFVVTGNAAKFLSLVLRMRQCYRWESIEYRFRRGARVVG